MKKYIKITIQLNQKQYDYLCETKQNLGFSFSKQIRNLMDLDFGTRIKRK